MMRAKIIWYRMCLILWTKDGIIQPPRTPDIVEGIMVIPISIGSFVKAYKVICGASVTMGGAWARRAMACPACALVCCCGGLCSSESGSGASLDAQDNSGGLVSHCVCDVRTGSPVFVRWNAARVSDPCAGGDTGGERGCFGSVQGCVCAS